tara:strand:+ start:144 stop:302 length:159 start_codon:yes stop_codon:yes gene_type:complete
MLHPDHPAFDDYEEFFDDEPGIEINGIYCTTEKEAFHAVHKGIIAHIAKNKK